MTSTKRQANLGSAPPMTRVEWAIARYNYYRACGLLSDSPQNTVTTTHERSPDSPPPKPHLKWYPLSKPDDDVATTYQPPIRSTPRHRYSQRIQHPEATRYQAEGQTESQSNGPSQLVTRVDWAIARYNYYRAFGLLGDSPQQNEVDTTQVRLSNSATMQSHLKWYPLNNPETDLAQINQRNNRKVIDSGSTAIIARYGAKKEDATATIGPGDKFDPSKHPRAEHGQHNGGQFVHGGNAGAIPIGETLKAKGTKVGPTVDADTRPDIAPLANQTTQAGTSANDSAHGTKDTIREEQDQAHFSLPPEKTAPQIITPESIPDLLEQFPLLPGETLEHLLTNLGYSLAGPKAYQSAWRSVVMRKIGITRKQLEGYADFQLHNQEVMKAIYHYYQSLYNSNPEMLWAGMAKVAGNAVWDGLKLNLFARNSPGAGADHLTIFFERELVRMNREIFEDLAWVHEAYRTGGMREINSLHSTGALPDDVRDAFALIDKGVRTKNKTLIQSGNEKLLLREQSVVLERGYRELAKRNIGKLMGTFGDNPIPRGRHFGETVNGGSITKFEDRWAWIKKEMIWRWNTMSPAERDKLVNGPLGSSDSIPQQIMRRLSPSCAAGHSPDFETMLDETSTLPRGRMTAKEYETLRKALESKK